MSQKSIRSQSLAPSILACVVLMSLGSLNAGGCATAQPARSSADSPTDSGTIVQAPGRRELSDPVARLIDCNANGMDDSVDLRSGVSSDTDKDGWPDDCGAFLDMVWSQKHGQLGPESWAPRDRQIRVTYDNTRQLHIFYAVSSDNQQVTITFITLQNDSLILLHARKPIGAYELLHSPRNPEGLMSEGSGVIYAVMGTERLKIPVAWKWR